MENQFNHMDNKNGRAIAKQELINPISSIFALAQGPIQECNGPPWIKIS